MLVGSRQVVNIADKLEVYENIDQNISFDYLGVRN